MHQLPKQAAPGQPPPDAYKLLAVRRPMLSPSSHIYFFGHSYSEQESQAILMKRKWHEV